MTKLRLIYVPTNRDCSDNLLQFLDEAAWAAQNTDDEIILCLIENSLSPEISLRHARTLENYSTNFRKIHFTEEKQKIFVSKLLIGSDLNDAARSKLKQLLLPRGLSYGRNPNLAYLLAGSLGADSVHRRDSDISFECMERLPIEMELAAIGKTLDEIRPTPVDSTDRYPNSAIVEIVGTSVFGDPTIDRRDLLAADNKFLVDFQLLGRPGVPRAKIEEEALEYLIKRPREQFAKDFYEPDSSGIIEMDAVCMGDIYKLLPEMPTGIIGCDYMVNDLNWRLHKPALFHSRKVIHRYDKDRLNFKNLEWSVNYALRDVQYLQMGRIWSRVGEKLEASKIWESKFDPDFYAETWLKESAASTSELKRVRVGAEIVYRRAAKKTTGELSGRLAAVANAIHEAGENLDTQVAKTVEGYAYLVRNWRDLMLAAKKVL